jgi:hypothetical protein
MTAPQNGPGEGGRRRAPSRASTFALALILLGGYFLTLGEIPWGRHRGGVVRGPAVPVIGGALLAAGLAILAYRVSRWGHERRRRRRRGRAD